MKVSEVAELCYNEGFRDKNLITIVAIAGAESNYHERHAQPTENRYGLFGIKPVSLSDDIEMLYSPAISVRIAREIYVDKYFAGWLSWATGKHYKFVRQSVEGVGEFFLSLYEKELVA